MTQRAFGLGAFSQLAEAVRASAREMDSWRFDLLVDDVMERAAPAVAERNACVDAAQRGLYERLDIGFSTALGVVESVASGSYLVFLEEGVT